MLRDELMFHKRFLIREMLQTRKQAVVFVLCVALSITTLVALNSFKRDVSRSITGDSQALHGGDVLLHSQYEFSEALLAEIAKVREVFSLKSAQTWEFYSVVRTVNEEASLFSDIKVVEQSCPLYGTVELLSGIPFGSQLTSGTIVVGQGVLDRLHLKVGDSLKVGSVDLRIVDVVVRESSRPVDVFNFGPRVFVARDDLDRLGLIKTGSRVQYEMALKVADDKAIEDITTRLQKVALVGQERVETAHTARSGVKRFFDNLLFFLSLISIFTLLLAGIGMQSSLAALLREKEQSLAIIKALGATHGFLVWNYLLLVLLLGLLGSMIGMCFGILLKYIFPLFFNGILPVHSIQGVSIVDVGEGMILGFFVVCFFTFLPLYRLRDVKPNVIFRSEAGKQLKGKVYYLAVTVGCALLTLLVVHQLEDVKTGIYFMLCISGLVVVITMLTIGVLTAIKRLTIAPLAIRQAVKSLLRPGNATKSVIVTLASSLSLLLAIFLVEYNLQATYIDSYPEDAPNVFFLDIQQNQQEGFQRLVGGDVQLFPIIRARLTAINDTPVNRAQELKKRRDSLAREFNLTYRSDLLPDETLIEGDTLFVKDQQGRELLQVSILDTVADMGDMAVGDMLHFNIQGVPLSAKITSVRSRTKSKLYPFFYFVFPPEFLQAAPQTFFAALHLEKSTISQLETKVVNTYPNMSVINAAETSAELGIVMKKLIAIVNFFALFSILAGALIIVSSILATRMARIREAIYYKVLGAKSAFVLKVFFYENMILGLLSSVIAVFVAQIGSWSVCHYIFEMNYNPYWLASLVLVLLTMLLVVSIGLLSSVSIIRQKPAAFLREQ